MTVDDCIAEYMNMAGVVFGKPRIFHQTRLPMLFLRRPKYNNRRLESVIQDVIGRRRRGESSAHTDEESKFKTARDTCKV